MKRNPQHNLDRLHKQYMKGQIGRRDFLKLLGIAGPASGLALALPSVAAGASAGLSEDEMVVLSHLPDQQIGKKYPKGETINIGFLCALSMLLWSPLTAIRRSLTWSPAETLRLSVTCSMP